MPGFSFSLERSPEPDFDVLIFDLRTLLENALQTDLNFACDLVNVTFSLPGAPCKCKCSSRHCSLNLG